MDVTIGKILLPGHPKNKKYDNESVSLILTSLPIKCSLCGKGGHNRTSCLNTEAQSEQT